MSVEGVVGDHEPRQLALDDPVDKIRARWAEKHWRLSNEQSRLAFDDVKGLLAVIDQRDQTIRELEADLCEMALAFAKRSGVLPQPNEAKT